MEAFREWDVDRSGTIEAEKLRKVMKDLHPSFTDRELSMLVQTADQSQKGVINYEEWIAFITSDAVEAVSGAPLPDGMDSDAMFDLLRHYLEMLKDQKHGNCKSVDRLRDLLSPEKNPKGYKLCQDKAVELGGINILVNMVGKKANDAVEGLVYEMLARMAFGNKCVAQRIRETEDLFPALKVALQVARQPEKLSALLLAQALAASCEAALPLELLKEVAPLMSESLFKSIAEAAAEVMVSTSFTSPQDVCDVMKWEQVALLMSEKEGRPAWWPEDPLHVLLGGMLATNLLSAPRSESSSTVREEVVKRLKEGRFLGYFVECLHAAVDRREWPLASGAYHSQVRLAHVATRLANLGHAPKMLKTLEPLTQQVQQGIEDHRPSLLALRALCGNFECLEAFLKLKEFRDDTLRQLQKVSEEEEAVELFAYTETVEEKLHDATNVRDTAEGIASKAATKAGKEWTGRGWNAPTVRHLAQNFLLYSPLDQSITIPQAMMLALDIPLVPGASVKTAFSKACSHNTLQFHDIARLVYGTARTTGLWPELMQDAALSLSEHSSVPRLPGLAQASELFEQCVGSGTTITAEIILDKLLPKAGLPVDGSAVEECFRQLHGDVKLGFTAFIDWLIQLCKKLQEEDAQKCAEIEDPTVEANASPSM